jgi:micrococcal nuclease
MKLRYALTAAALSLTLMGSVADCHATKGDPDDSTPVISTTTPPAPLPKATATTAPILVRNCKVDHVVDGDTVHLNCEVTGAITVRVIGIDTPETKDPRKPVQCFGPQASSEAKRRMPSGRKVRLTTDPTQSERDKYQRVLGYISIYGGDYGQEMIAAGFAREYTYSKRHPYQKRSQYRQAEARAKSHNLGLWGACPR